MPPPKLTVSEWADEYRVISQANAEPGKWRTTRVPYQREPMDLVSDPSVQRITLMWGAQTGKTDGLINNTIGYYIHQDPKSIMVMHPTQTDLNTWIEAKLTPLINETPALTERVAKPRSRDGVNNKTMKGYPGGYLMFSWSGSPNTQRGRSAPVILCDEIDGYEFNAEGDPVQLLWQRSATFGDARKLIETSTPTIKGISRIEKSFDASDQRRFYIPCPSCYTMQILKWGNVKWVKDELGDHDPTTAYYQCVGCEYHITDSDKIVALKKGEWRSEKPFKGHAGFHLNELYSPFRRWRDIVQSFIDKKQSGDLQSFVNVSLAETWEEEGESANDHELFARREKYDYQVPDDFWVLTAGVDVQDDRLEIEVVAWDDEERSANIDYRVIYGDPSDNPGEGIWKELDHFLNGTYNGKYGVYQIASACVDSGGHHTSRVYDYCKTRRKNRIFAIKGRGGEGLPIVSSPYRRASGREKRKVELYIVGVDGVKLTVMRRLQLSEPSAPGYCHFPEERDADYFKQLTAEKLVTRYKQGQAVRSWSKPSNARNEALDCRVYAFAALKILNPVWSALVTDRSFGQAEEKETSETAEAAETAKDTRPLDKIVNKRAKRSNVRRRRGFASSW